MMILKTSRLKPLVLIGVALSAVTVQASNTFECVRDLMPITEQATFQGARSSVESPFVQSGKFIVFPEVSKDHLTGFFVYSKTSAKYFDAVETKDAPAHQTAIADLHASSDHPVYSMVAQPDGLETVTLEYLPGFGAEETTGDGAVVLGSSVLPVVGALVSRANEQLHVAYRNPSEANEADIKNWIFTHSSRHPATANAVEINHQLMQLVTKRAKSQEDLWQPLKSELRLRKKWVQEHNLDESSFQSLSKVMETSCK